MSINHNLSEKSKAGRRLLAQVMTARQWAEMKANRRFKREKSTKRPYVPGVTVLGLSAVSKAIKEKYSAIVSRRQRRSYNATQARVSSDSNGYLTVQHEMPFVAHYNGEGPVRTPHNIPPSKWARG